MYYYSDNNNYGGGGLDLKSRWKFLSMTQRLIVINVAVHILVHFLGLKIIYTGCFLEPYTMFSQPWRLITCTFLHANFSHIFFNMYALYFFGMLTERVLGPTRMLILYLCSGLIGSLIWGMFCTGSLVGASGAVFGVMTAAAIAYPNARCSILFLPGSIKLWVMMVIYVVYEILSLGGGDNIAHLAHLGGALGGLIFMRRLGYMRQ